LTYDSKSPEKIKTLMTPDHQLVRTTGQKHSGASECIDALYKDIYAPFAKWAHVPYHIICYEVDEGWEMMGLAMLWWSLAVPGKQEGGGEKVKDGEGVEWDGCNPAAFNFRYKRDGEGIRLAKTEIAADPTVAVAAMLKRGMMKAEDLIK